MLYSRQKKREEKFICSKVQYICTMQQTVLLEAKMAEEVNFGRRVQNLRTDAGLSMEQLAAKLKISKSRVNMWENGGIIPRRDMLVKVAEFFGVSTDFLLGSGQEGREPGVDKEVQIIQRGLKDMNTEQHKKALKILAAAFDDIFNDDEED